MAWPKVLVEIQDQLNRIESKLDKLVLPEIEPAPVPTDAERAEALASAIDYDTYTVSEIVDRVDSLSPDEKFLLRIYEEAHKNRKMAITALNG